MDQQESYGRTFVVIPALLASLAAGSSARAQTADRRPVLEIVLDNRAPSAARELAAARTRARFIFADAGVRAVFIKDRAPSLESGHTRIQLVVVSGAVADGLVRGDAQRLGFAIPLASRAYVHYDRIHALARAHKVQPGWFLGVVIAHEAGHILLPRTGHADAGMMAAALSPDPKSPPEFTREEARWLRDRLDSDTTLAAQQ